MSGIAAGREQSGERTKGSVVARANGVLIPVLVLALLAGSCGGDDSANGEPAATTVSTTQPATTAPAPPATPVEADLVGAWTSSFGTWMFNEDGSYTLEGNQTDGGRWRFSESQQSITITTFSGDFCEEGTGGAFDVSFIAGRDQFTLDLKSDDCERLIFNTLTWQRE